MSPLTRALGLTAGALLVATSAAAGPVVRRANGANAAAIQPTVDQFKVDLGGANNGGTANPFPDGRREVNWDGVGDALSSPNNMPGDQFRARGAIFTTPGTGFQVSMDNDTPADADPDLVEFSNFNAGYAAQFVTFSPQRLFTAVGSTITDVTFRVPGTNRPASVKGFGVVFTDVDVFGPTTVEFFDERGVRIGPVLDSTTAFAFGGGVSFVGVSFDAGERIARVRIVAGDAVLTNGVPDGASDIVAMDDFIYGEPQPMAPAGLDTSFNTVGWTTTNFTSTDRADAVLVQPDGKIVVAGTWDGGLADFALVRYETDGTPDPSFSGDGRLNFTFGPGGFGGVERAWGLTRQSDGKLIVVGQTDAGGGVADNFAIARLKVDGTFDETFSGDGKLVVDFGFNDEAHAVAVQADGKIVVVGQAASDIAVLRLLPDGTLDESFNNTLSPTPENGNGRHRFTLAGTDFARAVDIQADGAIVIAGATSGPGTFDFAVVRLLANGALDASFSDDGWMQVDFTWSDVAEAVIVLPDGRIVAGGSTDGGTADFALIRVLPTGVLDPSFNPGANDATNFNGQFRTSFGNAEFLTAMALQADGKIVGAGYTNAGGGTVQNVAVLRITTEGVADTTFATNGRAIYELGGNEAIYAAAIQTDSRIVLAGTRNADVLVMRLAGGPTPGVYITTPTTDVTTSVQSPFVTIKGTAGDDVAVTEVSWTSNRGFAGVADGTSAWFADVPLLGGVNIITVTAKDGSGNTSTDTVTLNVTEFSYFLSEGATGQFFDLDILIANPTSAPADIEISYLKPDGTTVPQVFTLAGWSRRTIAVETIPGLADTAVSAVVRSTNAVPLVVERSMFWDNTYYGGHTGNAVEAPKTKWYFGEGNQGFFDTYVLLANANASPATATVTFLVEGAPNVTRVYPVGATSRLNVYAGEIPELANKSFSIVVSSTLPIIAERAMYFGTRLFEGGHESAGVSEPARTWFHAEGATGSYFDTYILIGNPNPTPANLTVTFLKGDGSSLVRNKVVPANGRFTLFVDGEDPALADTAVSTTVVSDIPVVSERAMYWAGTSATWFEAHNSFGVTRTGQKWALAEGRVGAAQQFETYVLVANPAATMAQVRATFLRTNGTTIVKQYDVPATSRF
ncbi:MAG TPA: hypothetical protein VMF13_18910, partial [Luteitalea sp.]|nr:hypothetical protein [Luteitalea sp.]